MMIFLLGEIDVQSTTLRTVLSSLTTGGVDYARGS
jgi:hypothetical protein